MKREEHKIRISTRHRKWKEQKGICIYCGRKVDPDKTSLDHIIPINSLEDEDTYTDSNLCMTCKRCNREKLDYIVFSNLEDRIIYPIIDIPYFFRARYIQYNHKDKK